MTEHTITPPPELVQQWYQDGPEDHELELAEYIAVQAARWGADQELEACLLEVGDGRRENLSQVIALRDARRPKPPSLKEQALMALEDGDLGPGASLTPVEVAIIRRALEALPE